MRPRNRRSPVPVLALVLAPFPAAVLVAALAAPLALAGTPAPSAPAPPAGAVVVSAVEDVFVRPDATAPVDDQVILGERVTVLEETAGFARVRGDDGETGWVATEALRRGPPEEALRQVEVTSPVAHVYRDPDVTSSRPLLTAPLGARVGVVGELEREGHPWLKVRLPDARVAWLRREDAAFVTPGVRPELGTPAGWIALGRRFLGAPYTWGGVTPFGFDCSGLVQTILRRHGVLLARNSSQMCFRDPQLVAVDPSRLEPGDLLFFGTEDKIDHMGMWVGDGTVLQATSYGVPSTKVTPWDDARLKPRFRYARRLALLPSAPKPGPLGPSALAALKERLEALAKEGAATYGIVFEDLAGGGRVEIGAHRTMHAASTMKTAVLLEVMRRVDTGTLRLTDEVPLVNEFRSAFDGSPFRITLDPESEGVLAGRVGKTASVELLATEMIRHSSNFATNTLIGLVGAKPVQELCDRLGAPTVKVRRGVEDEKAFEAGFSNETDAAGMAALMKACVRTTLLSDAARAKVWEILTSQAFNDQIPAGIPAQAGAVVAHKTGSISTVQHDAAIVRLPDGREYVLVLLATDFGGEKGRERVIETTRKMSRAAWKAMIAPRTEG